MRHGRLLAENGPEDLMSQYNMDTLEDVFLKLCMTDSAYKAAALAQAISAPVSPAVSIAPTPEIQSKYHHESTDNAAKQNGAMKNGIKVMTSCLSTIKNVIIQTYHYFNFSVSIGFLHILWPQWN